MRPCWELSEHWGASVSDRASQICFERPKTRSRSKVMPFLVHFGASQEGRSHAKARGVAYAKHHHSRPDRRFKANPGWVDISRNQSNRSVAGHSVNETWLRVLFTPWWLVVHSQGGVNKSLHTAGYRLALVDASIDSIQGCVWPSGSNMGSICKHLSGEGTWHVTKYQLT